MLKISSGILVSLCESYGTENWMRPGASTIGCIFKILFETDCSERAVDVSVSKSSPFLECKIETE